MAESLLQFRKSTRDTLYEEIVESLEGLPEILRVVFTRSHYEGQKTEEIARDLGIPAQTADRLLEDANQIFYRNMHRFHLLH